MVERALRTVTSLAALITASLLAGCQCGGGGIGERCTENQDCDPGLYCDPAGLVCVAVGDSGGSGTDAANCFDEDGDGVSTCDADCDDADSLTYPGAPEVCGDGVDNACGTTPDAGCMMLGTFVAPPPLGDDANPGTQAMPVATIAQGIINAMTIGGGVDVYVAAGTYAEAVTLVDGISLFGGHESAGWTRDPTVNVSIIENITAAGVVAPAGITGATELCGFTVSGLPGGEAAIDILNGSSPVIRGNVINGPDGAGLSIAVRVNGGGGPNAGASPVLERNVVVLGMGGSGWPNGSAGIRIDETPALVTGNDVQLIGDDILVWGILSWSAVPGLVIEGNRVTGASSGSADRAAGIEIGDTGAVVDRNVVEMGSCFTTCVAIAVEAVSAVITNNVALGGNGNPSVGLRLTFENPGTIMRDVLVHSNYLFGGGAPGMQLTSVGVEMINFSATTSMIVGRFINNVIESGIGDYRYCMTENSVRIDPELLESNDFFESPGSSPAIASGLYDDEGATTLSTIAAVNMLPELGAIANLSVSPMIVGTTPGPGADFHLMPGSPCLDVGSSLELPAADFEGDPRPLGAGPDIGPDES